MKRLLFTSFLLMQIYTLTFSQLYYAKNYLEKSQPQLVKFCSENFPNNKMKMEQLNDSISVFTVNLNEGQYSALAFYIHAVRNKCIGYLRLGAINNYSKELKKIEEEEYINSGPPLDMIYAKLENGEIKYVVESDIKDDYFSSLFMTKEMWKPRLFDDK